MSERGAAFIAEITLTLKTFASLAWLAFVLGGCAATDKTRLSHAAPAGPVEVVCMDSNRCGATGVHAALMRSPDDCRYQAHASKGYVIDPQEDEAGDFFTVYLPSVGRAFSVSSSADYVEKGHHPIFEMVPVTAEVFIAVAGSECSSYLNKLKLH